MKQTDSLEPGKWLDNHGDMLYRYAFIRVRNKEVAEDLLQETLLAGIQSSANFKGNSSISSWLVGILKHKIMDYYRKSQREQPLLSDADLGENLMAHQFDVQGHWQVDLADWVTPERALINKEFWEVYYQCQSRLSDTMAQLFMLRVVDGVSTEECCRLLGFKTDNQLWVALSRTRMKLRQCLETHWFNEERS